MVKLRLRRTGTRNKACFRIVAADSRSPRDGRFIEILGYYDPRHEDEKIDLERADYWLSHGAQASDTVTSIIDRAKKGTGALKAEKKKPVEKKEENTKNEASAKDEAKEEETKVEETKVEETKVEETKVEETKVEETKDKA